jgi:hypothetical protein
MEDVSLVRGELVEFDLLHDLADNALENTACGGCLFPLIVNDDLTHAEEEGVERVIGLWKPIMSDLKKDRNYSIPDELGRHTRGVVTDLTNQQKD